MFHLTPPQNHIHNAEPKKRVVLEPGEAIRERDFEQTLIQNAGCCIEKRQLFVPEKPMPVKSTNLCGVLGKYT